ncbi:DUF3667 domain-containing protein [Bernardetia sp. ABR2-2B]|uniref:DUF3667 domain-containing protein n=1 Tax=Bernardetia sp. ABR2-2B TaxID=3127472 RepID=UPI0030D4C580
MPTQLPTKTVCLNCDYPVKTENKYCPNCGQENADKRISLGLLLQDAFATAFNLESRVFKTIPYFLFYPGRLTNEFLDGKRVRYMHPFKIYLLSSILFFFVVIKLFTPSIEEAIRGLKSGADESELNLGITLNDSTIASTKNKDSLENIRSAFITGLEEGVKHKETSSSTEILKKFEEGWNKSEIEDSISDEVLQKITQKQSIIKDSLSKVLEAFKRGELNDSTINIDSLEVLVTDSVLLAKSIFMLDKKVKEKQGTLRRFFDLIQDRNMTPKVLLDSIGSKRKDGLYIPFAEQLLKIGRNDPAIFLADIINNIGTLMFFTLPILALFFKPFYIRRNKYYIDHLIFTLHLQAFTFIILTLAAIFFHWDLLPISIILFFGLMIYVWLAFKKVYKQGFFKTTIKAYMISFLYAMILIFMLSINLIYSFFMF